VARAGGEFNHITAAINGGGAHPAVVSGTEASFGSVEAPIRWEGQQFIIYLY